MLARLWGNRSSNSVVLGMRNGILPLRKIVWIFIYFLMKLYLLLLYDPQSLSLLFTQRLENLCLHKNLHMDVYCRFIHSCQNLEKAMIFFSRWINKVRCIQTTECYSALKINEIWSHEKTWRNLKCIIISEKINLKGCILYDSNQLTLWKSWNI